MGLTLFVTPQGRLVTSKEDDDALEAVPAAREQRIVSAFESGAAAGLVHLSTAELESRLSPTLAYARAFANKYLTRLCHTQGLEEPSPLEAIAPPSDAELAFLMLQAPPMKGLEYLSCDVLRSWWTDLDECVRGQISAFPGGAHAYLHDKNPLWRFVGRVAFHLAENKRDPAHPFAFMATYASRLSEQGRVQHLPLARALQEYAGAKDRAALVALLTPVHKAAEQIAWVKQLVDDRGIFRALAWRPPEAFAFLQAIPTLEASGLIVHVPDWWKPNAPPRAVVNVTIGQAAQTRIGLDALLDFHTSLTLDGERLTAKETRELLESSGGLVRLRGRWVELDKEKLAAALEHWKKVERIAGAQGVTFAAGMRLLAGAHIGDADSMAPTDDVREWTGLVAGEWLDKTLTEIRDPNSTAARAPADLQATLRPYQLTGVHWLRFMTRLGLGACLADDMGLGKTIQVLALLLHIREQRNDGNNAGPCLLVAPASLIANWMSEIERFSPVLRAFVAHPSETDINYKDETALNAATTDVDLVITTYGMLMRLDPLRRQSWNLVVIDEAQEIKNSGARQTRAVKELSARVRVALTGTPVENRLSDLWSLFDFLNAGLLGNAKSFARFVKELNANGQADYAPLRRLVRPYILRRLKTDKQIIADLPEKLELKAFCGLSKRQAALYQQAVRELGKTIETVEGIQRRGVVLAYLMRFKQICNHPSQWTGVGNYDPEDSGKFLRIAELCQELAERQEKVLVFTQFREVVAPLVEHLQRIFGRPGLMLHGGTAVAKRKQLVDEFQRDDGPPFIVLSLKAGGTGLNLTAACHVIHFDRWWNPAVENQATDRAFRIGQKRNVMVHKFVCRGTVEEKIDQLISGKVELARDLLDEGAEKQLTEMTDRELISFVALDVDKAVETQRRLE